MVVVRLEALVVVKPVPLVAVKPKSLVAGIPEEEVPPALRRVRIRRHRLVMVMRVGQSATV